MQSKTDNLRIRETKELMAPIQAEKYLPATELASQTTAHSRTIIHDILNDKDDRLLVIVGPCSIHDTKAALEYAKRLKSIKEELRDDLRQARGKLSVALAFCGSCANRTPCN
jgi:3-deoxy-7-phosphoheptulonate synthase